ncbi:MAG: copper amine oxidase N-terminal domain-containing protein [Candidatus Eremiobacteraeota bacterium]|nr:copper amine oxidase N-terminal domain-containing protein [Candidatus Eremiobacteraeota bacterium]
MPAMNFGAPPSGQIPILFNDHHVYSKPDKLKQGRVLAALVRGNTILIPLRSMFEQMGATVSYNAGSKTVDVSKPGSDVKVTVGKPEVIINGESRPLDVPPEIYQGHVVVPVRVISEGMGAYVQWVPDKKLVVVRYVNATPPPPPAPPSTPVPTVVPTPTPGPAATPYQEKFIAGDYILGPKVYNEFDPGIKQPNDKSYAVRGAAEFSLFNLPWMLEGDYRQIGYQHNQTAATPPGAPGQTVFPCFAPGDPGCVTVIGGQGQTFVPNFSPRDYDFDGRLGLKVADPRLYVGVGYMFRSNNYGYPKLRGVGFGAEKLPDLNNTFSVYGSAWYYPSVKGNYTDGLGNTFNLAYKILKYQVGATLSLGKSPFFIDGGFLGDKGTNKTNAPSDFTHSGGYLGLGIHF